LAPAGIPRRTLQRVHAREYDGNRDPFPFQFGAFDIGGARMKRLGMKTLTGLVLASPLQVAALEFNVTRFDDPPPDGCIAGDCSLREAVITANQLSGADRIVLQAGLYILTIEGGNNTDASAGDLAVLDPVDISGAGAAQTIILASHDDRHFAISSAGVTIRRLRLDGGRQGNGGAILHNGGMTLEDAILTNNQASIDGGAIRSASGSMMLLRRVQFVGNSAQGQGGAISSGTPGVTVVESLFEDNSAQSGGAIGGREIHVRDSVFSGNSAVLSGGAIDGVSGCSCSWVSVSGSTFVGNTVGSKSFGGALNLPHPFEVRLSTFSANSAGAGGAIRVDNGSLGGPYLIAASTFAGNSAQAGSAVFLSAPASTDLELSNNLIAGTCASAGAGSGVIDGLGNVEGPGDTCNLDAGNIVGAAPAQFALAPLADNGGPTPTHLPGGGSIVTGAGLDASCTQLDQRGLVREDGDCDAGSVEVGAIDDVIFRNGFDP
jgi:predicted outer membrane repeat protein